MGSSEHFGASGGTPSERGRFVRVADIESVEMLPGLNFQPILGAGSIVNVVTYAPHTEAPMHQHSEAQVFMVLDGEMEFTVGDETRLMKRGDVAVMPPWVRHGGTTRDSTCVQLDFFTPERSTLLEHASSQVDKSSTFVDN